MILISLNSVPIDVVVSVDALSTSYMHRLVCLGGLTHWTLRDVHAILN